MGAASKIFFSFSFNHKYRWAPKFEKILQGFLNNHSHPRRKNSLFWFMFFFFLQACTLSNIFNCWLNGSRSGFWLFFWVCTKSSKLKTCLAEKLVSCLVQVVGGRGKELAVGGSRHLAPAKVSGLVLWVTWACCCCWGCFFLDLMGSEAHLEARVLGFDPGENLGFWGVLKPSEVGEGVLLR